MPASIHPFRLFRFDYQKVQQAAANLLDNSLKHTPAGGTVTLRAGPHFWERRVAAGCACGRAAAISFADGPIASKSPWQTPALGLRPSIIRRFLKILCALTATLRAWASGWPLPSA